MAPPNRSVIWSSDALADLDEIWTHYAQIASRGMADKTLRKIQEAVRLLASHPFAGRSRDEIRLGLRSVVASPHIIFYRVKDDTAEIVRVLDGRQDIEEIFSERS
jgi:toxin ParE1/3/4